LIQDRPTHDDHLTDVPIAAGAPASQVTVPPDGLAQFRLALFARTPRLWVTPLLVGINVAVFLGMVATGVSALDPSAEGLLRWGANYAPRTTAGEWWRLVTNVFVHIGVIHIAMNMLVLWQIGALVERLLGHRPFLLVYLVAGFCGSLASISWHPLVISAGASSAVFGIYGVLIAHLVLHRGSIPRTVLLQLQKSTAFFIGLNVLFGLQQKGIDMAAHVGGLAGGFAAALLLARPLVGGPRRGAPWRELLVLAAAALLFGAAVRLLPRAADVQKELTDFHAVEERAIDEYNGALERRRTNRLSDEQLAKVIDDEIIPPWRSTRGHLATLRHLPAPEEQRIQEIGRYMLLREQGWRTFSEALRTGDDGQAGAAKSFQQQADTLFRDAAGQTKTKTP